MLIANNLRRIGNILTRDGLKEYLGILVSVFLAIFDLTRAILMHFEEQGLPGKPLKPAKIQTGCQTDFRYSQCKLR